MTDAAPEIEMIPIDSIRIINSRVRNQKIFREITGSIADLGLKRPVIRRQFRGLPRRSVAVELESRNARVTYFKCSPSLNALSVIRRRRPA